MRVLPYPAESTARGRAGAGSLLDEAFGKEIG
jgi:hypothetical protein